MIAMATAAAAAALDKRARGREGAAEATKRRTAAEATKRRKSAVAAATIIITTTTVPRKGSWHRLAPKPRLRKRCAVTTQMSYATLALSVEVSEWATSS